MKPTPVNMRNCQKLLPMHVKKITEKISLLKISGPQIRLCLFTFRPIVSKHLNSLTTILTLSCLGGAEVTHLFWMREVSCSIPGSGNVWFFGILLLSFYFFLSKTHYLSQRFFNFFFTVNLFSIVNILQDLWPIIRVITQKTTFKLRSFYWPIVFNCTLTIHFKIPIWSWDIILLRLTTIKFHTL